MIELIKRIEELKLRKSKKIYYMKDVKSTF